MYILSKIQKKRGTKYMNSTIKGKDFVLNSDIIFQTEFYDLNTNVVATCFGATKKYRYDEQGNKTDVQVGWSYEVYVPKRKLMLSVSVESLTCAFDLDNDEPQQVNFTNFRATFYVNRKGFLELSCKAEGAERVKNDE